MKAMTTHWSPRPWIGSGTNGEHYKNQEELEIIIIIIIYNSNINSDGVE